MAYITATDLEVRIGRQAILAIYDDDNDGVVDAATLADVCDQASARVDSYLATSYKGALPLSVDPHTGKYPSVVKQAAVEWARYMAFDRHPEYVRMYGTKPLEEAKALSSALAKAEQYLPDNSAEPAPRGTFGIVYAPGQRLLTDSPDGQRNGGDLLGAIRRHHRP